MRIGTAVKKVHSIDHNPRYLNRIVYVYNLIAKFEETQFKTDRAEKVFLSHTPII